MDGHVGCKLMGQKERPDEHICYTSHVTPSPERCPLLGWTKQQDVIRLLVDNKACHGGENKEDSATLCVS